MRWVNVLKLLTTWLERLDASVYRHLSMCWPGGVEIRLVISRRDKQKAREQQRENDLCFSGFHAVHTYDSS